jgi:outer membrane protein
MDIMTKIHKKIIFILCIVFIKSAFAVDLMDVYFQALDSDPTFKSAYSKFLAQNEALPQAWSAILPQITADALLGRSNQLVDTGIFDINRTYNNNEWVISASQTIFNYQAWSNIQQAQASIRAALATFNDAAENLILRTASAYLNVLLAKDTLSYAESKKRANKRQLDQAQERFNVGLDAITSVYEAQAAYDQSVAEVIASKNNVHNQNQNLSKLTNHLYEQIAPLRNNQIPLIQPEPNKVEDWVATGLRQNFNLFAAKYNLEAARENIKVKTGGNWPVLSINGSKENSHFDVGDAYSSNPVNTLANNIFIPEEQSLTNVSINLHFPIFQGGLVASQTRQAKYEFQTSSQELEKAYREVIANSHIAFNTIHEGISKIKADRQTLHSQQSSLDSVFEQYKVGTRTMTDVVTAQRNLFEAQKQLATDQYDLINAILNLKYLAGNLNVDDLSQINSWLITTRSRGMIGHPR